MKSYRLQIPLRKRSKLFNSFVMDELASSKHTTTHNAAMAAQVNRRTALLWYRYFREQIALQQMKLMHFAGEIEIDHHTFNARRAKRYKKVEGKWVPIPTRSIIVFALLERDLSPEKHHRIFVQVVKRTDKKTTEPIVNHVVDPGSKLYSDSWRGFLGLQFAHKRVNHDKKEFARTDGTEKVHTGTLDEFWRFCDRRLERFNGISSTTIALHILECAFRYNHKHDLKKSLEKIL